LYASDTLATKRAAPSRTSAPGRLQPSAKANFSFRKGDAGYLVPATGEVEVGTVQVGAREELVIENEKMAAINALRDSEFILIVTAR